MKNKALDYDPAMIERADHFQVSIFLGVGRYHTEKFLDLAAARQGATEIAARVKNGRRGMIYAVTAEGRSTFVPPSYRATEAREGAEGGDKATKPARGAQRANKGPGRRAAATEAALRGEMPTPPDFSAATHRRFRPKLAKVVEMAEAGDLEGLKALEIRPVSSSPKAIAKYRDLAVTALEARGAL